jgi:hypothetical protein
MAFKFSNLSLSSGSANHLDPDTAIIDDLVDERLDDAARPRNESRPAQDDETRALDEQVDALLARAGFDPSADDAEARAGRGEPARDDAAGRAPTGSEPIPGDALEMAKEDAPEAAAAGTAAAAAKPKAMRRVVATPLLGRLPLKQQVNLCSR